MPPRLHDLIQAVFPVWFAFFRFRRGRRAEKGFQFPRRLAGLAGVCLVHNHRIFPSGDGGFPFLGLPFLVIGRLILIPCPP